MLAPIMALALAAAAPARGEEAAFMALFACQNALVNLPRDSHTMASFIRTTPSGQVLEEFTISWIPERLSDPREDIHLLQRPEPGRNYTREATLGMGEQGLRRNNRWGPFQIRPEFFRQARERYNLLNSGRVRYTVLDHRTRDAARAGCPGGAVNCIHAVMDIWGPRRRTGTLRGASATEDALVHFLDGNRELNFVRYPVVHEWLAARLGFADVPHAGRVPQRGFEDGRLTYYPLRELEQSGAVRRSLESESPFFEAGLGVRLLGIEAIVPPEWRPVRP